MTFYVRAIVIVSVYITIYICNQNWHYLVLGLENGPKLNVNTQIESSDVASYLVTTVMFAIFSPFTRYSQNKENVKNV